MGRRTSGRPYARRSTLTTGDTEAVGEYMMTSNEERSDAARALRETSDAISDWSGVDPYHYIAKCAFGDTIIHGESDTLNRLADLIEPEQVTGETSDGYHTFNELYDHRAALFSALCSAYRDKAWKSMMHSDGNMFEGMFVVGIDTPGGQATYHYYIDPWWDVFDVPELERAPEFDGHTSSDVIDRIKTLRPPVCRSEIVAKGMTDHKVYVATCPICGHTIAGPNSKKDGVIDAVSRQAGIGLHCKVCGAKVVKNGD